MQLNRGYFLTKCQLVYQLLLGKKKKEVVMTNVIRVREWADLLPERFSNLVDRLFNEAVSNFSRLNTFMPNVDIVETDSAYEIHVAVPGLKKEDFKVEVSEGRLTISGERKFEKEEKGRTYHKVETQYGSFSRYFFLPEDVKAEGITAEYVDGILKVALPKDEKKAVAQRIEVK
ncbi:MAG: Hsp20/alpha crystallin family protein [Bacteroidia bacterium]